MILRIIFLVSFVNPTLMNGTTINYTKVNRAHLTFVTYLDEYRSKSNNILTSTISKSANKSLSSTNIRLDFHKIETFVDNINGETLILVVSILVILIVLGVVLILAVKKFAKFFFKNCCCPKKKKILTNKSDSALSGECGCIVRFRKNKNTPANSDNKQTLQTRGNDVLSKANQAIRNVYLKENPTLASYFNFNKLERMKGRVKSALVLISIKNDFNENHLCNSLRSFSGENINLIKRAYLDSGEDLNEYNEYTKKSLINIRKELLDLDQPNERLNFKV